MVMKWTLRNRSQGELSHSCSLGLAQESWANHHWAFLMGSPQGSLGYCQGSPIYQITKACLTPAGESTEGLFLPSCTHPQLLWVPPSGSSGKLTGLVLRRKSMWFADSQIPWAGESSEGSRSGIITTYNLAENVPLKPCFFLLETCFLHLCVPSA